MSAIALRCISARIGYSSRLISWNEAHSHAVAVLAWIIWGAWSVCEGQLSEAVPLFGSWVKEKLTRGEADC